MSLPSDPLVRSAVRATRTAQAGDCPDAEVLALYAEGDLDAAERQTLETHLAACGRCQATLAAFVRAAPEVAAAGPAQDRFLGWFTGWRWLVPVASVAAVAVVAVWIGQRPSEESARMAREAQTSAPVMSEPSAPPPTMPGDQAPARFAPAPVAATPNTAPPAADLSVSARAVPARPPGARDRRNQEMAQAIEVPASQAAAAPPPPPAGVLPPSARADAAPEARQELAAAAARDAAVAVETPRPLQETVTVTPQARESVAAAAPALRRRADESWRVRDGRVERSLDEGRTWRIAATPGAMRIFAVASVSPTVCWAIASDAVLRTIDGTTWTIARRPSSEPIASIAAGDATTATVTTATGTTWTTSDGGATWRRP